MYMVLILLSVQSPWLHRLDLLLKQAANTTSRLKRCLVNRRAFRRASIFIRKLNPFIWAQLKPDRFQQIKLSFFNSISHYCCLLSFTFPPFPSPHHLSPFCHSPPPQKPTMTSDDPWNVLHPLTGLYMLCQLSVSINWLEWTFTPPLLQPWAMSDCGVHFLCSCFAVIKLQASPAAVCPSRSPHACKMNSFLVFFDEQHPLSFSREAVLFAGFRQSQDVNNGVCSAW